MFVLLQLRTIETAGASGGFMFTACLEKTLTDEETLQVSSLSGLLNVQTYIDQYYTII